MFKFLLPVFLAVNTYAGQISVVGPFRGLNDSDPSVTLADGEAQSLLNAEVSKDGNSVSKRSGYSLIDTMAVAPTTAPIHGSILFRSPSGANIEVYASNKFVYKSENSGAFSAFITTATVGAKWSFCDTSGKIYGFNDQHDEPFSYDGTTVIYYPGMPKASVCAMTPDRMLLAGTTDQPNRLYFSGQGDYTNFTLGTEPNDPSFDDIGLTGDKITGLWANGAEWLIWKTNSLISYQGTNQYDLVASVISNRVGLSDPKAIVEHNGVVYFMATDGKVWAYLGGMIVDTTKKLEVFNSNQSKDTSIYRQYAKKVRWDLGTFTNTASTITNGSIEPWLVGFTDTLDADFNAGTASSVTVFGDAITINNFAVGTFPNIGLEMGTTTNWVFSGDVSVTGQPTNPMYGNYSLRIKGTFASYPLCYHILDESNNQIYSGEGSWGTGTNKYDANSYSLNLSTFTQSVIKVAFGIKRHTYGCNPSYFVHYATSAAFIKPNTLIFKSVLNYDNTDSFVWVDFPPLIDVTSATFVSQSFNTGTTSRKYCELVSTQTVPGGTYALKWFQSSTDSVTWASLVNTTDYLSNNTTNQYVRYKIEFQDTTSYLKPEISAQSINCIATGTWTSDEYNTGSFASWGTFSANETTDNASHWTHQISTSAVVGGTGSSWYTITNSSAIGIPLTPYVKLRATSNFTSSTETIRLNNIGYSYGLTTAHLAQGFEYLGDIYFAVPYSGSTTNNRVIKLDLNAGGWTIFDIAMNAPLVSGNSVHFGSPTGGKIYTYPLGNSDEGVAINSYWKSKDFMGDNVYVERNFDKLSIFLDSDYSSDVDATYTIEPSTSITYNIPLTQTDGSKYIRNNRQLPMGTRGTIFNLQLSNNAADKPWRFFGSNIEYTNDGWIVYP